MRRQCFGGPLRRCGGVNTLAKVGVKGCVHGIAGMGRFVGRGRGQVFAIVLSYWCLAFANPAVKWPWSGRVAQTKVRELTWGFHNARPSVMLLRKIGSQLQQMRAALFYKTLVSGMKYRLIPIYCNLAERSTNSLLV